MARREHTSPTLIFGSVAVLLTALSVYMLRSQLAASWVVAYLVGITAATFLLYGYDKTAARRRMLRVPERVLHASALAGGTAGALLGQQVFRHKTQKSSFRVWFWLFAVIQVGAVAWWALR